MRQLMDLLRLKERCSFPSCGVGREGTAAAEYPSRVWEPPRECAPASASRWNGHSGSKAIAAYARADGASITILDAGSRRRESAVLRAQSRPGIGLLLWTSPALEDAGAGCWIGWNDAATTTCNSIVNNGRFLVCVVRVKGLASRFWL